MSKTFEDELMHVQTDMISLGMEITEGKADYIFVYCSNEKYAKFFNAFFAIDGKLTMLHELKVPDDIQWKFLDLGQEDLAKVDVLGKKYNKPVPIEIKLGYQVASGKIKTTYLYESPCKEGETTTDVFERWMEVVRKGFKLR